MFTREDLIMIERALNSRIALLEMEARTDGRVVEELKDNKNLLEKVRKM